MKDGMMGTMHEGMKKMHGSYESPHIIARQGASAFMRSDSGMPHNNPLTKTGRKVMSGMMESYGEKGKKVFYGSINKGKKGSSKWHK